MHSHLFVDHYNKMSYTGPVFLLNLLDSNARNTHLDGDSDVENEHPPDRNTFLLNLLESNVENVEEDTGGENENCEDANDCEN